MSHVICQNEFETYYTKHIGISDYLYNNAYYNTYNKFIKKYEIKCTENMLIHDIYLRNVTYCERYAARFSEVKLTVENFKRSSPSSFLSFRKLATTDLQGPDHS